MQQQKPIYVLRNIKARQQTNKALLSNIQASRGVAELLRSTLGPNGMMKMIVSSMGTVITNDGHCVLRDVNFEHPAAKFIVELARTQDQESGDGTTSVILLTCEFLDLLHPLIKTQNYHPNELLNGLKTFQSLCLSYLPLISKTVDFPSLIATGSSDLIYSTLKTTLGSKVVLNHEKLIFDLVFKSMSTVLFSSSSTAKTNKIRNWRELIKLEKIEGGFIEDSYILNGVIIHKEPVTTLMPTSFTNPKILVLSAGLEYKKTESQTELEMSNKADIENLIKLEEKYIEDLCEAINKSGANLVFCDKGSSDLANHFLSNFGISVFRNNTVPLLKRICKASGAEFVSNSELLESLNNKDTENWIKEKIGKNCGKFEVKRINDEFISFLSECENSKSCSIVLRGADKSAMKEIEANIEDAIGVMFSLYKNPKIVPGGGATEIFIYNKILEGLNKLEVEDEKEREVVRIAAEGLLVVPKILAENCGKSGFEVVKKCLEMNKEGELYGVNGITGEVENMEKGGVFDAYGVKEGVIKTAVNSATMMFRIGDVLSGLSKLE